MEWEMEPTQIAHSKNEGKTEKVDLIVKPLGVLLNM